MHHIKVNWIHSNPANPVTLYSEIDQEMWEVRKVEVFADGHRDFADANYRTGSTRLGIEPLPSFDEISSDPEFQLTMISAEEFETEWQQTKVRTTK